MNDCETCYLQATGALKEMGELEMLIWGVRDELKQMQELIADYKRIAEHCEHQREHLAMFHARYDGVKAVKQ